MILEGAVVGAAICILLAILFLIIGHSTNAKYSGISIAILCSVAVLAYFLEPDEWLLLHTQENSDDEIDNMFNEKY